MHSFSSFFYIHLFSVLNGKMFDGHCFLMSQEVALLTDGRFSGGSHGFVVGHICPEAQVFCVF